eukprot:COSAG01_NODE_17809_length_1122_cov_2.194526_1_plen_92_part_00
MSLGSGPFFLALACLFFLAPACLLFVVLAKALLPKPTRYVACLLVSYFIAATAAAAGFLAVPVPWDNTGCHWQCCNVRKHATLGSSVNKLF